MATASLQSVLSTDRPDLGIVASPWFNLYGLGPESQMTILNGANRFDAPVDGVYGIPSPSAYVEGAEMHGKGRGIRGLGQDFETAIPGDFAKVTVALKDFGIEVICDHAAPYVKQMTRQGGIAQVEQEYMQMSVTRLCDSVEDFGVKGLLGNATTPFDHADIVPIDSWDDLTNGKPLSDIASARIHTGLPLTDMWLGFTPAERLMCCPQLTVMWGGAVGLGRVNGAQLMEALASCGIKRIHVGRDEYYGYFVSLTVQGPPLSNPRVVPCGVQFAVEPVPGADQYGITYSTIDRGPRKTGYLASMSGDVCVAGALGVRLAPVIH